MNKKELRKIYKQKREALAQETIHRLEQNIYNQVFELNFAEVENIHIFLPITKQKEINTYPIIDFLRQKGKRIVISKSCFKTNTLGHYIFDKNTKLVTNTYGIPEPVDAEAIAVKKIEWVFVPLLVSDKKNYRVGYGKGFYDRFLANCIKEVKTIGLNFFEPIYQIEDVTSFDIPLHKVIYPR